LGHKAAEKKVHRLEHPNGGVTQKRNRREQLNTNLKEENRERVGDAKRRRMIRT